MLRGPSGKTIFAWANENVLFSLRFGTQALGKITAEGVFIEQLETNPGQYLPEVTEDSLDTSSGVVSIDLNQPMDKILNILTQYPTATRLELTGSLIVARDMAHAKLKERIDAGEGLPQYAKVHTPKLRPADRNTHSIYFLQDHIIYYAGPAKQPDGLPSGSFGPTTAGRMDSYVDLFMEHGGSMISLAKGNRARVVTNACKKYGGFYLGSIGGPAAVLAEKCIKNVGTLSSKRLFLRSWLGLIAA